MVESVHGPSIYQARGDLIYMQRESIIIEEGEAWYDTDLICAELGIPILAHVCRGLLRSRHHGAESLRVDFHWG